MQGVPYRRLSSMYFFYFASLGAFVPFWSLYLREVGFSPVEIGELIAIVMGTKIIAPIVWGYIADHTGKRLPWMRLGALFATLFFIGVLFDDAYWWMAIVMAMFSFFWNAILPLFESTTLNHLAEQRSRYSHIRLWGSIGFIVTSIALGPVFEETSYLMLPWFMLGLLGFIVLSTLMVTETPQPQHQEETQGFWKRVFFTPAWLLMVAFFLMQLSHGPYYAFFSIYLSDHGYGEAAIGMFWGWGVIAEVAVFLFVHQWLRRVGAAHLLAIALAITAVRWLLIAFYVDNLAVLIVAQTMHAASYGLFHASAIHLVHYWFPGKLQSRGQALYSSVSFGLGNAVGSWASGHTWVSWSPELTYVWASMSAFLGVLVVLVVYLRVAPKNKEV